MYSFSCNLQQFNVPFHSVIINISTAATWWLACAHCAWWCL